MMRLKNPVRVRIKVPTMRGCDLIFFKGNLPFLLRAFLYYIRPVRLTEQGLSAIFVFDNS